MLESDQVQEQAIHTIREIISGATICMLTNSILEWSLRPGSLESQWMDTNGDIWFLVFRNANEDSIAFDGRMEVFYSDGSRSRFLSLVGEVRPASFEEGEQLPGFPFTRRQPSEVSTPFILARFTPYQASYWDAIIGGMVPLALTNKAHHGSFAGN